MSVKGRRIALATAMVLVGTAAASSGLPDAPRTVAAHPGAATDTVTAMWNYAQAFAMSDNNFETGFGPSTPGVLNLAAANTFGATCGTPDAVFGAVARFVEDNLGLPRLGGGAVEADAGQLNGLFDFSQRDDQQRRLILNPTTGQPREQR